MDTHSFTERAKAQRWIGIAGKILVVNDLFGSKTFAIRAREFDPSLESVDQILAIADTLLAAEKSVIVSNASQQHDFYGILQLVRFSQDTDHISSQYRRLFVMLNPHQNKFPYSDRAFALVNEAWAVLSNPMRKLLYDADLDFNLQQQQMNSLGNQGHEQQQLQQYNILSQNRVRPIPIHVQPFHFTFASSQQTNLPPQPPQPPQPPPPRLQRSQLLRLQNHNNHRFPCWIETRNRIKLLKQTTKMAKSFCIISPT